MDIFVDLSHALWVIIVPIMGMFKAFALMDFPYASLITLSAFAINGAVRARKVELKSDEPSKYWFHSLMLSVFTSFFGGTIVPIMLGKPPVIMTNDKILPVAVLAWYGCHRLSLTAVAEKTPVRLVLQILGALFRCHGTIHCVILANGVLQPSVYGNVALIGPIIAGTIMGSAGMFFPLNKGLAAISKSMPWGLQGPMFTASVYHILIHDRDGFLGVAARGAIGDHPACVVKICLVIYWVATVTVQTLLDQEANFLTPFHKFGYLVFQVTGPIENKNISKPAGSTVGWDFVTRQYVEYWLEALRVVIVVVAVTVFVVMTTPGTTFRAGRRIGVNTAVVGRHQLNQVIPLLPQTPTVLRFEAPEGKGTLRLATYGCSLLDSGCTRAPGSEPTWVLKTGYVNSYTALDDVYLTLGEDGRVRAVEEKPGTMTEKELWRSSSPCATAAGEGIEGSPVLRIERGGNVVVECPGGQTVALK